MTTCSTHVLDAALGLPAAGITVQLSAGDGTLLSTAQTDDDGRISWPVTIEPGPHTLDFATGAWFAAAGRETFFPTLRLVVDLVADRENTHVALLLSPYSYTTYRGS
ncbi:MAG: Transthyretin [Aeromicrobium sp.]|nr:Transthyretin [Aeromicrobium sp.]